MTGEQHLKNVGFLIGQLQCIEYSARVATGVLSQIGWSAPNFPNLRKGAWVPKDAMTDFKPLGAVLKRFNELAPPQYRVDARRLADLRDLLAHGRLISVAAVREMQNHLPLVIVKFGRAEAGRVPVTDYVEMTEEWFTEQCAFAREALNAVSFAQGMDLLRKSHQSSDEGRKD